MDELQRARAELSLLEDKARWLLKELLGVRAAASAQRAKIDGLVRTRTPAIYRLPTEILFSILDLDLNDHCYSLERKEELSGVCRRWRDVILESPGFWTTIYVARLDASSVTTHLERSRGALLHIVIQTIFWAYSKHLAIIPSLDVIASCPHRWQSLLITDADDTHDTDGESECSLPGLVADRINHLQFPSLKSVRILGYCNTSLDFLCHAPSLEHLELEDVSSVGDINFPQNAALKSLKLELTDDLVEIPPFLRFIQTQTVTRLSVRGSIDAFALQPNSIHLPSIKVLEMACYGSAREFMTAIVAPNLERFTYFFFKSCPTFRCTWL